MSMLSQLPEPAKGLYNFVRAIDFVKSDGESQSIISQYDKVKEMLEKHTSSHFVIDDKEVQELKKLTSSIIADANKTNCLVSVLTKFTMAAYSAPTALVIYFRGTPIAFTCYKKDGKFLLMDKDTKVIEVSSWLEIQSIVTSAYNDSKSQGGIVVAIYQKEKEKEKEKEKPKRVRKGRKKEEEEPPKKKLRKKNPKDKEDV